MIREQTGTFLNHSFLSKLQVDGKIPAESIVDNDVPQEDLDHIYQQDKPSRPFTIPNPVLRFERNGGGEEVPSGQPQELPPQPSEIPDNPAEYPDDKVEQTTIH